MPTHPFPPLIPKGAKKLLVGTLPPEGVNFYFSNSSNTRLWDLLKTIRDKTEIICKGSNSLSAIDKENILKDLGIGITDIIYDYEREEFHSTKDKHIIPKSYKDLLELAYANNVNELLFVYRNAFKWFLHSLEKIAPVRLRQLKRIKDQETLTQISYKDKTIKLTLLPSPLNRGRKGETLVFKVAQYTKNIQQL